MTALAVLCGHRLWGFTVGWRPATVTVKLDHDMTNPEGEPRIFDVRFPDDERVRLRVHGRAVSPWPLGSPCAVPVRLLS